MTISQSIYFQAVNISNLSNNILFIKFIHPTLTYFIAVVHKIFMAAVRSVQIKERREYQKRLQLSNETGFIYCNKLSIILQPVHSVRIIYHYVYL